MKKYSFILSLLLSLLLFGVLTAMAAPGDFLFEFGDDYRFTNPRGVAVDGSGNIYVADTDNYRIQVFTGTGAFLRKWGGIGSGDGQFDAPSGIAVDGSGNVYVADAIITGYRSLQAPAHSLANGGPSA
jgi:sugar lactone lactonase YvrE